MGRIAVRVTPGANEDAVTGWRDGTLQVRVRAAPEHGKANEAVCRLIAETLGVPKSRVEVARGGASREKVLMIAGMNEQEIRRKLGETSR